MRWPWQPAPGLVRVNHRKLIDLQRSALRAAALEAEIRQLEQERLDRDAETRARELLEQCDQMPADAQAVCGPLLADLPRTGRGVLHETAFLALVERSLWQLRDEQLAGILSGTEDRA